MRPVQALFEYSMDGVMLTAPDRAVGEAPSLISRRQRACFTPARTGDSCSVP
jgi:hypothetical protein